MFRFFKRAGRYLKNRVYKGHLESHTNEFSRLAPTNTKIIKIDSGFRFTEGPVWIEDESFLHFSDIPANRIYKLNKKGDISVFREPSNNSNGLTLDKEKRLIACEHGKRRLTRTQTDGSVKVLAESFEGKKLNSPNDVVVTHNGRIYFTDPPFGIKSDRQEQKHNGVYMIDPDNLELKLVSKDFERPNGLAFSPEEDYLYIDDSWQKKIIRYKVRENGELENGILFYEFKENLPGNPDGMKVDTEGNLYCTGPGGISVISPAGNLLGKIVLPEIASNCAWGEKKNKTLFITAQTSVYKIKLNIEGNPL